MQAREIAIGLAVAAWGCGADDAPPNDYLLEDGFETADLLAWSGVTVYAPASLSVLGGEARSGAYALQAVNTYLDSGWWQGHVYKDFGIAYPRMHVRLYFLARALPPDGKRVHLASLFGDGQEDDLQFLSVANSSGTYQLSLFFRDGGVTREATWDIPGLAPDVWNAVEMHRVAATLGSASVWWNGTQVIDVTGTFSDASNGQLDEVHLAMDPRRNAGTDWVQETWFDDVVVAESYIGP